MLDKILNLFPVKILSQLEKAIDRSKLAESLQINSGVRRKLLLHGLRNQSCSLCSIKLLVLGLVCLRWSRKSYKMAVPQLKTMP